MSFKCGSKLYSIKTKCNFDICTQWKTIYLVGKTCFRSKKKKLHTICCRTSSSLMCNYFIHYFFLSKFIWQSSVHLNIMILIKRMETQSKNLISQSFLYKRKQTSHGRQKHLLEQVKLIKLCVDELHSYIYLCVCIIYICMLKIWSCQLNVVKLKNFKESIAKISTCLGSSSLLPLQMN